MTAFAPQPPGDALSRDEYLPLIAGLLERLFPICRSITGEGARETLRQMGAYMPLQTIEVPSGTRVFDWEVPREWNVRDAFVKNSRGERVIDFQKSNLHLVSYSVPVSRRMRLDELRPHLHTLPSHPTWIPYLTSYYKETWGFCLAHDDYVRLVDDVYEVCIDSTLEPGSMTLAEAVLPGETDEEIFFSTYCCHPSMANNELSGPVAMTTLYRHLSQLPRRRFTYRFYIGPETIGAIAYLSMRGDHLAKKVNAGFVLTCCGDPAPFTYKQCRDADHDLNRIVGHVCRAAGVTWRDLRFFPTGSDERQFSSPGFNLPMGSLMRSMYGEYDEYHTSADDLTFVTPEALLDTVRLYVNVIYALERNRLYRNLKPFGEPHLGKYGLYRSLGGAAKQDAHARRLRFLLNFSDGRHDLLDIAERAGEPVWAMEAAVDDLLSADLLAPHRADGGGSRST